jgi:hypothetical protein
MDDEPHAQRRGWLKNNNPPGDFLTAPRCGAKTRHHASCRGPAMRNGRCRMHGGLSTGPRTREGLERSQEARWTHGNCSLAVRVMRTECWRQLRALLNGVVT